jgi:hypothetical protein
MNGAIFTRGMMIVERLSYARHSLSALGSRWP